MKSLCNDMQKNHLEKLLNFIIDGSLNGGEAWSAFSSPASSKKFTRDKKHYKTIKFTTEEVETYKALRIKVKEKLFNQCLGCCAYCRRSVGHYGWAWHIEHVIPKSKYPELTFDMSNLTVGCVHCNQWKGARVDKQLQGKKLPIINPLDAGFVYPKHLTYVQISTESLCFAKYSTHSKEGQRTYELLSFKELERAYAINGMHAPTAALHERLTRLIYQNLDDPEGLELVELLGNLKLSIYMMP
jgi:5-methylcytosine-specific restriction endonuclease McrA